MNSKDIKKYSLICAINNADILDTKVGKMVSELAAIDYQCAFEVWEYKMTISQESLGNLDVALNLESNVFDILVKASENRFRQLFTESIPLNKLVYSQCASSCSGANLQYLGNLILANKLEAAEELLRCVRVNTCENLDFGVRMKSVVDTVFDTYCSKNSVKKCDLNKKQTILLIEAVSKIKGPNKKLLTQRLKEL